MSQNLDKYYEAFEEDLKNLTNRGEKILVRMVYEKLSNYCFCYGYIGHRCRKCAKCKSQPKEGLAYWV